MLIVMPGFGIKGCEKYKNSLSIWSLFYFHYETAEAFLQQESEYEIE